MITTDPIPLLASTDPVLRDSKGLRSQTFSKDVSSRWYFVLSLHLAGRTAEDISELSGYSTVRISQILNDPRIVQLRQQMLADVDKEFEALYSSVVGEIRFALSDPDPKIRLEACEKWLKAHGRYKVDQKGMNITAEDIVINILNQYGG